MSGTVALYIIGGIVLFCALIGAIRVEVVILYAEEFGLRLRIAGIPITIVPGKKKEVKLKPYTVKARKKHDEALEKKRLAKAAKAAEKKKKKEEQKKKKAEEKAAQKASGKPKKKGMAISDLITLGLHVLGILFGRFGKHVRVRIARLHVAVGSEDAAKTAMLYGTISQAACYVAHLLDACSTLRHPARADVDIHADYLSETISADVEIGISIFIWQLFDIINRIIGSAVRDLFRALRNARKKNAAIAKAAKADAPKQPVKKFEPRKEI